MAALACGLATSVSAGELKLTMQGGRVTIIADNVPLRQILQEWARVGQTQIVNADKVSGPALTLQLIDASERDALDILLRSASGYIAAPRPVRMANASFYDRVTIMATSHPPVATVSSGTPPPTFQRPPAPIDDGDEPINVAMPPPGQGQQTNPLTTSQFPGIPPQPPSQPGQQTAPITSPRPGAVQAPPAGMPNPYQYPYRPPVTNGRGGGPGGN
jgi:hypothetical protein